MSHSAVGRAARAAAGVVAVLVLMAVAASAAELQTAELAGTVNNVTVEQGQTVSFQISLTATGTIRCAATPTTPATAKVDTHYTVDATGTSASDTLSAPQPFYADRFCNVTWPGDPTPQAVSATLTADINAPVGDHAIRLHTVMTTPPGTGSTLQDATPTIVTFHVVPGTDKTPPIVTCTGPGGSAGTNGWYTSEVSYSCSSSDPQSGLADPADASFTLTTTGDGADSTPSRTVKDKAGNATTVGPFGPFNIDTGAPTVVCGAPSGTAGSNGWYTSAVAVSCSAGDEGSGLADPADASFTLSTSGEGSLSIAARAVADTAGNSSTTGSFGPFKVDTSAPVVGCSDPSGTAGSNGWYTSPVTVLCTASDSVSGLADASDASFGLSTSGEGLDSIAAHSVDDIAGNASSTGSFGPFNVDLNDPTIALSSPADGATFILGSDEAASYSCTDTPDGSGVGSCSGTRADGSALDTSSVGQHNFTVNAIDGAGRHTTVTHTYSVVYDFTTLSAPAGKSSPKAGGAIPMWFSLDGISDPSVVRAIDSASCGSGTFTPVAMNGPLRYDASSDRFMFVWKTDKAWAGSCRTLRVSLNDGTTHSLSFTFN